MKDAPVRWQASLAAVGVLRPVLLHLLKLTQPIVPIPATILAAANKLNFDPAVGTQVIVVSTLYR